MNSSTDSNINHTTVSLKDTDMNLQSTETELNSAIYTGQVRHRRFSPKAHDFTYKVFMVYLDLQELDTVFAQSRWWSKKRFNIARFRRSDFFDRQEGESLYETISHWLEHENGRRPEGPIRMLTNLRYFGFIINPITCYYCFDSSGETLQTIILEVTNTPWGESCHYILNVDEFGDSFDSKAIVNTKPVLNTNAVSNSQKASKTKRAIRFTKKMHVSPFQPMNLEYLWVGKKPAKDLLVHIDVQQDQQPIFDVTLTLKRQSMNRENMNGVLWRYPVMTLQVVMGIYWQALMLLIKRIPFYSIPK